MESEGIADKRAEIDTRAPFQSVKEAVILFGERVLAGEVYANKLKEMRATASENGPGPSKLGSVTAELEETRENLMKAREESELMAHCLSSLKQELEQTRKELRQLKGKEPEKPSPESETEDIKFIEDTGRTEDDTDFQKKRYVKFANPPSLAQVMTAREVVSPLRRESIVGVAVNGKVNEAAVLERHPSLKKKKKPLIPLIGGIFSRKKSFHEGTSPKARAA